MTVGVEVVEEGPEALPAHAALPIAFEVESLYRVVPSRGGPDGLALVEVRVAEPWVKDYDALNPPHLWPERWASSTWSVLSALEGHERLGGAVVVCRAHGIERLAGRDDVCVLWDLRVRPDRRGRGIGTALFERATAWARARHCTQLEAETQSVNVPACRFYARRGCVLGAIDVRAYADLPDEAQLLWHRRL